MSVLCLNILEYFEYLCVMSSKSICIILSYTVSKFTSFLRLSVVCWSTKAAISLKRVQIEEKLLWVSYKKGALNLQGIEFVVKGI